MPSSTLSSTPYAYPLLIKQLLHTPLLNAADQEIVYKGERRHTYRDFATRIAKLANVLKAQGVKPGDTVAVMDWDSHRYLEAYFAIPMMGATLMTVNIRLSQEQIAYTVDHAGASVLLVHEDFLPVVESILVRLPKVGCMVLMCEDKRDGVAAHDRDRGEDYESQIARASGYHDFPDFDEHTRATTFYTTGTTGLPKAVYFSHRQLVLHTLATATGLSASPEAQRFHRGDVYMPLTPMFHVHAWGLPYVATLLGVKQVYPGRYVSAKVIELIQREGVTFSHGVPTVLQMVLDAAGDARLDGWKVVAGGAVLPPGLCRQALDKGIDIFTGYGMSETCPMMTLAQRPANASSTADEREAFRMRAGWAIPLVDLRIVDEHMCDVAHDDQTPGEVVVRAPWLTQGYRGNPAATDALWQGGYLHTNDIGRMDGTGALRLIDRLKDVIKTGGEWVSSLDLEHVLAAHPGVAEVAVIGVPHERWGERPLAIVKPRPEFTDTLTEEELRQMVTRLADQGVVPRYAVPDQVRFVEAIDRTSVGKFDKKALRLKFASAAT